MADLIVDRYPFTDPTSNQRCFLRMPEKGIEHGDCDHLAVVWAWHHRHHLKINVEPYRRIRRWLFARCDGCGYRFFWKQGRYGYQSSDKVYHDACMSLRHTRSQLDDAAKALQFTADDTTRWRVERWLQWREEQAAKPKSGAVDG